MDISTVRNLLRRRIGSSSYTPIFRARAVATLTALAEFVLTSKNQGTVEIIIINQSLRKGLALQSHITTSEDLQAHYDQLAQEISCVADEIECFIGQNHMGITARIWLNE
jgi:hypothetical protein